MWSLRRKPESAAQIKAENALDAETREVAWQEFEKEGQREQYHGFFGPFNLSLMRFRPTRFRHVRGDAVPEPVDDPDPSGEDGLRKDL